MLVNFIIHRIQSFIYAITGFKKALKSEANLQIHVLALVALVPLGLILKFNPVEWIAILTCSALVISCELINTAVEKLSDFVEPQLHPKIAVIKDISASAVLITALFSSAIGIIILFNKYI